MMKRRLFVFAALTIAAPVVGTGLARGNTTAPARIESVTAPNDSVPIIVGTPGPTRVMMRNVDFYQAEGVILHIRSLDGEMNSVKRGVVDFDDKFSYILSIDRGDVTLSSADLTNLMNKYVFAYPGAPLKNLKVSVRGTALGLSGTLHKGVNIPFDITSNVSMTPDEKMRLHPTQIKIFGVDGAVLMRALGINLQKMLDLSKAKGVFVQGNDLLLSPLEILPPPRIKGRIAIVKVGPAGLEQLFAPAGGAVRVGDLSVPDSASRNYMLYRGGTLHFGKLYMTDAELFVVDLNEQTPFEFDNDHYQRQLIAGHSRTLPSLGLEVYMPDASAVTAPRVVSSTR
jgi:hypothetical protein